MKPHIEKVIKAIADDVLLLAQIILEDDSISVNEKVGKNTLKNSALKADIQSKVTMSDSIVIDTLFNNYVGYIEWDRPKKYGKQPPIDSLRDWAQKNGIPTDNSTLYLISRAIWRDGHKGRPIFATLENNVEQFFNDEWFDKLFEAIITEIREYFN